MKKEYEIRHYLFTNPAWQVESFWTNRYGDENSKVEGEFYSRKNARLFLKALKEAQRPKKNPPWTSSVMIQRVSKSLAAARRMQGWA